MKHRIYEYAIVTASSEGELSDKVSQTLRLNGDCQPFGSPVIYLNPFDILSFAQAVVYRCPGSDS